VFTFGYVEAMRTTMLLPVVLLGVGAVSCLLLRERRQRPAEPQQPAAEALAFQDEARTPDQAGRA
jgi:hypothetical protein